MKKFSVVPIVGSGGVMKVMLPRIPVYHKADVFSEILCYIVRDVMVKCLEVYKPPESTNPKIWARIGAGWIMIADGSETKIIEVCHDPILAERFWQQEVQKQDRMASAISSMLVRSYSLPKAKRLARSLLKHATTHYPQNPLVKITNQSMEDIMIILDGKIALTKQQVFEYIKAAAARQSNPLHAVIGIAERTFEFLNCRPTTWVTDNMNILITEDVRVRNNIFVMSAAEGDVEKFDYYVKELRIDLLSLHSELHYTALHAAADFGQLEIIRRILETGLSLDIKDPLRGQTALHFAADSGRAEVALLLINSGANRELTNNEGVLPFQAAHKHGYIETREILKFLPPPVSQFEITNITIHSISLIWKPPELNREIHAEILEFELRAQFVEGAVDIPDPPTITTHLHHFTYTGLFPSCLYRFRIRCRSVSGWSEWGAWTFGKTLAHRAEAPLPLEVRKVSVNGMVLTWFPPKRDNGFPIDFYQLEIADYHAVSGTGDRSTPFIVLAQDEQDPPEPAEGEDLPAPPSPTQQHSRSSQRTSALNIRGIVSEHGEEAQLEKLSPTRRARTLASRKKKESEAASQGGVSKYYRLVKHKQLDLLMKYITGLEPHRLYLARVRAHNELGFSPWSGWTPPVAPKIGAWLKAYNAQELSMTISWFAPLLNPHREVERYEVQICNIQGPLVVFHPPASKEVADSFNISFTKVNDNSKPSQELNEFITLTDQARAAQLDVGHLKAGRKYQFRVRAKLRDEKDWPSWESFSVLSDTIQMAPTIPDAPLKVRPFLYDPAAASQLHRRESSSSSSPSRWRENPVNIFHTRMVEDSRRFITYFHERELVPGQDAPEGRPGSPSASPRSLPPSQEGSEAGAGQNNLSDFSVANSQHSEFRNPKTRVDLEDVLDISHEHIGLTFTSGDSNGEAIEAVEIQMSKIRHYHFRDIVYAKEAFLGVQDEDEDEDQKEEGERPRSYEERMVENLVRPFILNDSEDRASRETYPLTATPTMDGLAWRTVFLHRLLPSTTATAQALEAEEQPSEWPVTVLGKQIYRVAGLVPGDIYVFRVRVRNKLGWSPFSHSSPLIATYPSLPPDRPRLLWKQQTFALFAWRQLAGSPPLGQQAEASSSALSLTTLEFQIQIRQVALSRPAEQEAGTIEHLSDWAAAPSQVVEYAQLMREHGPLLLRSLSADQQPRPEMSFALLSGLVDGDWYVLRIRLRTVIGWSPWSPPSEPFRMAK